MRIKVSLKTEKLPVRYQFLFVSVIKESLKAVSSSFYALFQEKQKTKPYTYSVFMKGFKMRGEVFDINGHIDWYISSPNKLFLIELYNGLQQKETFHYGEYELNVANISLIPEKPVKHSMVVCESMSPLFIKDKEGLPVNPESESFQEELNYITNIVFKETIGRELKEPISFHPLEMKKIIRKIPSHKTDKEVALEMWKGTFALSGDKEDISTLYQLGIGFKRSQGSGMFEIQ